MFDFAKLVDELKNRDDLTTIFSNEKFIHDKYLNSLGLHIFRSIKARLYYKSKLDFSNEKVVQFYENGFLEFEDLISAKDISGGNFTPPKKFLDLIQALGFTHELKIKHRRHIHYAGDPQYNAHTDTFHPTLKIWVYNDNVTENSGAFHFSPETQCLTQSKISILNKLTNRVIEWNWDKTHPEYDYGSFRIPADIVDQCFFEEFTGAKYTTVFADPCGFHYRGKAKPGTLRDTFYILPARIDVFPPLEKCLEYHEEQSTLEQIEYGLVE